MGLVHAVGTPQGSLDLLAQAALAAEEGAKQAWQAWRSQYDIDTTPWSEVRMLGAVAARIDLLEPDCPIRQRILGIRKFLWVQSQFCIRQGLGGLRALNRAGIPVLLLKGAARIARDPSSAQERLIRDVDVLVPLGLAQQAHDCLQVDGWSLVQQDWQVKMRQSAPIAGHHGWAMEKDRSEIDLHHFSNFLNRLQGDDEGLWRRALTLDWQGVAVQVPSPADALLIALVHGLRWSVESAADWTIDACAIIDEARLDWQDFLDESRRRMLEAIMLAGLDYLRLALNKPIPDFVIATLRQACDQPRRVEQRQYAISALPQRFGDINTAGFMAARRALRRAGLEGSRPVISNHLLKRFREVSAPRSKLQFRIPVDGFTADWLIVKVELDLSAVPQVRTVLGRFVADGLSLSMVRDVHAPEVPADVPFRFSLCVPRVLWQLRMLEKVGFIYSLPEDPGLGSIAAPLEITLYAGPR